MKALLVLVFLLTVTLLFPGCYTILLIEPTNEVVSSSQSPITIYIPEPYPAPEPPSACMCISPAPPPDPPPYFPPPAYVNNNPPSAPPSSDNRRLIQTGRGSIDSNPAPEQRDQNNSGTRDFGLKRSGR